MIRLYSDEDLWNATRQRNRILKIYLGVLALYVAAFVAIVVLYVSLPYNDPSAVWYIVGASVLTALFIFFSFPFLGICFKRSNAYYKMIKYISVGLKEYDCLPFAGIEDWITHDGVDVNVATFTVRNRKRDEDMLRQVYIDGEKDFPDFQEGHYAKLILQGNLLIEYELMNEQIQEGMEEV